MPDPSMPCGGPALKRLYGRFRGSPQGGRPVAVLYPFGHPMLCAYAVEVGLEPLASDSLLTLGFCLSSAHVRGEIKT
jgi:hypothetical protein